MNEGTRSSDDPLNEFVATTGLFLIITAIIAVAFALASWGANEMMVASIAGIAALVSFAVSIVCFESQATEVPA